MSVSIPPCTCRKWAVDPECEIHGNPGQLTLEPEDERDDERYDPATAPLPEGY